jgi:hypothetical protein
MASLGLSDGGFPHFGVLGIFEGVPRTRKCRPGLSRHMGGSTPNRRQCFALEPTAEVGSSRRNSPS